MNRKFYVSYRIMSVIITGTFLFSCGNSSTTKEKAEISSNERKDEENVSMDDHEKNNSLKIIPVYKLENDQYQTDYYAFKKGNNYIIFSNDENYSNCIPTLRFIEYIKEVELSIRNYIPKEQLLDVDDTRNKLVENVIWYLEGHKDKISDKDLYKIIDKAYYNKHPNEVNRYTDKNFYNDKFYSFYIDNKVFGHGSARAVEYEKERGHKVVNINGEELDDDVLIVTIL